MRYLPWRWALVALPGLFGPAVPPLVAQEWNDPAVMALIESGIQARRRAQPDSTLQSYRTLAHGFVFFLGQVGRGMEETPRLIKADELVVEVYWRAPATSKQVILGWRDGRWLPTDVNYHRDHLGIVTDNFGDRIRIGEGDEVRDVPHPLAPGGPLHYEYRLADSVRLELQGRVLTIREVEVRPRDPRAPRVIGTLSLDQTSADLVRFRFSFTPAAYLDRSLEDISVALENARVEGRWWLPWRQEIEIRRRVTWLDFPARSVIRGRWEIGEYTLNAEVPPRVLAGPAIGGLRAPAESTHTWPAPLEATIRDPDLAPADARELEGVRDEAARIATGRTLSGLARARPGLGAVSDLARVNRVQGLALGLGAGVRPAPAVALRAHAAFGTSDERLTGRLRASWERGGLTLEAGAARTVRDLADRPVISTLVNSLLAQEGGRDHGDYVLLDRLHLGGEQRRGPWRFGLAAAVERTRSVRTEASPVHGAYRPNPPLGAGTLGSARTGVAYRRASLDRENGLELALTLEAGTGDRDYLRSAAAMGWWAPAGPGVVGLRLEGGAGSRELPGYRSFAVGGWGSLPGEPFRAWGGRRYALGSLEYRLDLPVPAIPLGGFVSTGDRAVVAPFVAAGWAGGRMSGLPWRPSDGLRPVAGVAVEWLHRLIRAEAGVSLHTGNLGISVDVGREWWEVL